MDTEITLTNVAAKIKGSCSNGHEWEYSPLGGAPTIQFDGFAGLENSRTWCVLCIEEKLVELGIGTAER